MDRLTESIVTIAVAIIGLATLAVIVSKQANTSQVIGSAGNAFTNAIGAATAPVTGAHASTGGFGGFGNGMFNLGG